MTEKFSVFPFGLFFDDSDGCAALVRYQGWDVDVYPMEGGLCVTDAFYFL